VVTKLVTANNMIIYPGASEPGDRFSFQGYIAQLSAYKSILSQLIDEFGSQKDLILKEMKASFGKQLEEMAEAEAKGRLSDFTPEQMTSARKLLAEVLTLYGLRQAEAESQPAPAVVIHLYEYGVCQPCPTYYAPRRGLRRWRCR
jgi:hypothetical protein